MYDYKEEMKHDIREAIKEDYDLQVYQGSRDDIEAELFDRLWLNDSVTGNGSGSYTLSNSLAKEYVMDNMDLVADMVQEFDVDSKTVAEHFLNEDWEFFDVSVRCYLLHQEVHEVLDELEVKGEFSRIDYDSARKPDHTIQY